MRKQSANEQEGITIFAGCIKPELFEKCFSRGELWNTFVQLCADFPGLEELTIYGEGYGGKIQGRRAVYGEETRFVAFDVRVKESGTERWLDPPDAQGLASIFALRFVDWKIIPATVAAADAERDAESVEAVRNGVGRGKWREGIVLRPLKERVDRFGNRVILKHRRPDVSETKAPREISTERVQQLADAAAIADEWVTEERVIRHVLPKLQVEFDESARAEGRDPPTVDLSKMSDLIRRVLDDVRREGADEIVWSKDAERAVGTRAALVFKRYLQQGLVATAGEIK